MAARPDQSQRGRQEELICQRAQQPSRRWQVLPDRAAIASDIVKTVYDAKRGGQQSAWREGAAAVGEKAA